MRERRRMSYLVGILTLCLAVPGLYVGTSFAKNDGKGFAGKNNKNAHWTQKHIRKVPPIMMYEPYFSEMFDQTDRDVPYNYEEAVKLAGHSCGATSSAWEMTRIALEILYPKKDFLDKRKKEKWRDTNNNSLVVKANFGKYSFLLPGDIMKNAESELVSIAGETLVCTVLIAPHHGSKSSSSCLFLDKVNPEYIIISSGWKNRFHFPHPSVLKRYAGLDCKIFRTDINGAITMATGGHSLEIMPYITGSK